MLTVTINGVDKTSVINWRDFSIEENITKEPDICKFSLKYLSGGYAPLVNQIVSIELDSEVIFEGTIIDITKQITGGVTTEIKCTAKDYTFDLDRKLVTYAYENEQAESIIADIVSQFTTGFTVVNVQAGAGLVAKISFNYEYPSKAIQKIADMFGWDWYVGYDKDIHFFPQYFYTAPFTLNETDKETFIGKSLNIREDLTQVKNAIYVRGGTELYSITSANAEIHIADGQQTTFALGRKYANDALFHCDKSTNGGVSWTPLTVGNYGTDDPASFNVLYDPNTRALIFPTATKPAATNWVRVYGNYYLPVIIYRTEESSVAKYGLSQFRILDNSIGTKNEAKQKALAEIKQYKETTVSGNFRTYKDGLSAGQWVVLNLPSAGISGTYRIQRVQMNIENPDESNLKRVYQCSVISSELVDIVDVLGRLLISDQNQNVQISENEIIDLVVGFLETITISETWVFTTYPSPLTKFEETLGFGENWRSNPWGVDSLPVWVAGDVNGNYYPTSGSDQKRCPRIDAGLTVQ